MLVFVPIDLCCSQSWLDNFTFVVVGTEVAEQGLDEDIEII